MTPDHIEGPRSRVDSSLAYERARLPDGVKLRLDANEGSPGSLEIALGALRDGGAEVLRRYPDARPFEAMLARHFSLEPWQVFVAAGADEVIDRCCRAFLPPGASMLIAEPGFEMFDQYAGLCGANVVKAAWAPGPYPLARMLERVDDQTAVIALVTPNNPTGEVAGVDALRRLAAAAPRALVILDHAYVEFADTDLTSAALAMPNVVVVRTFSKAWGLAGCRVGYALGPARIIRALRAAGGPFPVSSVSLAIARAVFEQGTTARDEYVARIRVERRELFQVLTRLHASPRTSEGNFVFAELGLRAPGVHGSLVAQGVLVRLVSNKAGVPLGLRIALPGELRSFDLLRAALEVALQPAEERA
ncbi:MAG TPA: histidinol-phosphate transaminase [Gemmatimonadaceae bacterium]